MWRAAVKYHKGFILASRKVLVEKDFISLPLSFIGIRLVSHITQRWPHQMSKTNKKIDKRPTTQSGTSVGHCSECLSFSFLQLLTSRDDEVMQAATMIATALSFRGTMFEDVPPRASCGNICTAVQLYQHFCWYLSICSTCCSSHSDFW